MGSLTAREREVLNLLARGMSQRRHRRGAGDHQQDGQEPPLAHLREDRRALAGRGDRALAGRPGPVLGPTLGPSARREVESCASREGPGANVDWPQSFVNRSAGGPLNVRSHHHHAGLLPLAVHRGLRRPAVLSSLAERARSRGQTAAEYMGVLLVVSVIIAGVAAHLAHGQQIARQDRRTWSTRSSPRAPAARASRHPLALPRPGPAATAAGPMRSWALRPMPYLGPGTLRAPARAYFARMCEVLRRLCVRRRSRRARPDRFRVRRRPARGLGRHRRRRQNGTSGMTSPRSSRTSSTNISGGKSVALSRVRLLVRSSLAGAARARAGGARRRRHRQPRGDHPRRVEVDERPRGQRRHAAGRGQGGVRPAAAEAPGRARPWACASTAPRSRGVEGAGLPRHRAAVPVGPLDKDELSGARHALQGKGRTPIGASLLATPHDLGQRAGRRSVVLVSDGGDNCAPPDPCKAAAQVAKQGVDLSISVVGLQVDERVRRSCSASRDAGGGSYVDVKDAGQLGNELAAALARAFRSYEPSGTAVKGAPARAQARRSARGCSRTRCQPGGEALLLDRRAAGQQAARLGDRDPDKAATGQGGLHGRCSKPPRRGGRLPAEVMYGKTPAEDGRARSHARPRRSRRRAASPPGRYRLVVAARRGAATRSTGADPARARRAGPRPGEAPGLVRVNGSAPQPAPTPTPTPKATATAAPARQRRAADSRRRGRIVA